MNEGDRIIAMVSEKLHEDSVDTGRRIEAIHKRVAHDLRVDLARCGEALRGFQYRNPPDWHEVETLIRRCETAEFILGQEESDS